MNTPEHDPDKGDWLEELRKSDTPTRARTLRELLDKDKSMSRLKRRVTERKLAKAEREYARQRRSMPR